MAAALVVPDFLIAVVAAWLGASVVTRAPRDYVTRVFGLLTALLTLWATARVIWHLTSDPGVRTTLLGVEAALAAFLPAALLHFVLAFTAPKRRRPAQRTALLLAYGVGALASVLSIADRRHPIAIRPPYLEVAGLPGPAIGWGWIVFRAAVLALAVWWVWRAWRAEGAGGPRRGQLGAVLAAVACGALGGVITILVTQLGADDWLGTSFVAVSLALGAYAVLAYRLFLAPDVARLSFYYSLGAGVLTAAYIALLLGLERLSRSLFAINTPLVTSMALVLTIALFDPVRERVRAVLDRGVPRRDLAHRRLLRALGDELLATQQPDAAVGPALTHLCRALRIRDAAVLGPDGAPLATFGLRPPAAAAGAALALPLATGGRAFGQLVLGPKRSRRPYTAPETDLLASAAAFIAASLHLAERQTGQAAALDALAQERATLLAQRDDLARALAEVAPPPAAPGAPGLQVYALGPLRVERDGAAIRQWGGAKAGTRQAEAVFAFLFDRGERGVAKDEFLEVIWPDVDIEKADLAFHRTLGGLRRTLEPDLKRGSEATCITYHNDRYRLDPALVAWSDVGAFQDHLAAARAAADPPAALAALEEARALYRGDYLDDCPFYGDSEYVEERRTLLRGRFVDLLLALGARYEARDDAPAAAACYREALQATGDDCPRAEEGLARLRVGQSGSRAVG